MKSPATQLQKFSRTLEEGFWQLTDTLNGERHISQTATTITEWVRDFNAGKNLKQIIKTTKNLLQRAAEYAEILELDAEIASGDSPVELFAYRAEKPSNYFKTKSWK